MTTDAAAARARLVALLTAQDWTFAKTMPQIPHEWAVRKAWKPVFGGTGSDEFTETVRLLDRFAFPAKWGGRTYHYFRHGGWKYWQMGYEPEICYLINRARDAGPDTPAR